MTIFTILPTDSWTWEIVPSSSIDFFKDLKFLSYRLFTCLVRVTPRYFIVFEAIVKGVDSLISFSAHLSFACRRAADFLRVNLVFNLLTKGVYWLYLSGRVLRVTYVYYLSIMMLWFFSFPICILLISISFSCLVALANVRYWLGMERADNLVMFLILLELLWVSI